MLVLLRQASESGVIGSGVFVGELKITVLRSLPGGVRMSVDYPGGQRSVSMVPYNRSIKPLPGVEIKAMMKRRTRFSTRHCRLGIDAPKSMDIERDDMIEGRAA